MAGKWIYGLFFRLFFIRLLLPLSRVAGVCHHGQAASCNKYVSLDVLKNQNVLSLHLDIALS